MAIDRYKSGVQRAKPCLMRCYNVSYMLTEEVRTRDEHSAPIYTAHMDTSGLVEMLNNPQLIVHCVTPAYNTIFF